VGDNLKNRGCTALGIAVDLLASGTCRTIVAGWLDVWKHPPQAILSNAEALQGAIFVVLSTDYQEKSVLKMKQKKFELFTAFGMKINTIVDLFSL
jgi:hypothetical protein